MEVKMKRTGLLIVGFIFVFVGICSAAPDFAKYGTMRTNDKLLRPAKSVSATTAVKMERATLKSSAGIKAPALKSGGVSVVQKVGVVKIGPQGQPVAKINRPQGAPTVALPKGGIGQKALPVVKLPAAKAPAAKSNLPAIPKVGGGLKIGGGLRNSGISR